MLVAKQHNWRFFVPKHKSLIKNVSITNVKRAHNSQHDSKCRLQKGESRLTVKEGRNVSHYTLDMGEEFLKEGIVKFQELLAEIQKIRSQFKEESS